MATISLNLKFFLNIYKNTQKKHKIEIKSNFENKRWFSKQIVNLTRLADCTVYCENREESKSYVDSFTYLITNK